MLGALPDICLQESAAALCSELHSDIMELCAKSAAGQTSHAPAETLVDVSVTLHALRLKENRLLNISPPNSVLVSFLPHGAHSEMAAIGMGLPASGTMQVASGGWKVAWDDVGGGPPVIQTQRLVNTLSIPTAHHTFAKAIACFEVADDDAPATPVASVEFDLAEFIGESGMTTTGASTRTQIATIAGSTPCILVSIYAY